MATLEASDTLDDGEVRNTSRGWEATRGFRVAGLSGPTARRLTDAVMFPGVPRYGERHPSLPINVVDVQARYLPDSPHDVSIRVSYRVPDEEESLGGEDGEGEIEVDAVLISSMTYRDVHGEIMRVQYDGVPYLYTVNGETQSAGHVQILKVITATVERPQVTVRVNRTEGQPPIAKAIRYSGRVNQSAIWGYGAGTWLCRRISSRAVSGGRHKVTYELVLDPSGWRLEGAVDYTGLIPFDATPGNGIEYFTVYPSVDFAPLRLSIR